MVGKSTVVVFGAGASIHYGFPIWSGLYIDIVNRFSDQKNIDDLLTYVPEPFKERFYKEIPEFIKLVRGANSSSIDIWLTNNPDYLSVGKLLITACLLPMEKASICKMEITAGEQNWYRGLLLMLRFQELNVFMNHDITFITFNYDRSFEFYTQRAITSFYGQIQKEKLIPIMRKYEPMHVHGRFGCVSKECKCNTTEMWIDYDKDHPYENIFRISQEIDIAGSGKEENLRKIRKKISRANNIIVIGFGFDEGNMQQLFSNIDATEKNIICADYDLTADKRRDVEKRLSNKINWIKVRTMDDLLSNPKFTAIFRDANNP